MSNEYYDHTTYPTTGAFRSSSGMRAELAAIESGFNKLPVLSGNGRKTVRVNAAGNALESSGVIDFLLGANIASAATIDLTSATGNLVHVTGTTAITAVTLGSGMMRQVIFDGILTLTHHATNNNLPGAANITTAAGDRALYWSDGTTVYCISYTKADGTPVAGAVLLTGAQSVGGVKTFTDKPVLPATPPTGNEAASADYVDAAVAAASAPTVQSFTSSGTWNKPAGLKKIKVTVTGSGGGGGGGTSGGNPSGGAGAAGGTAIKWIDAASLGATETVTINAAGTGGSAGNNGTAGGTASFGAHCSANGGALGNTNGQPSSGGTASGGDINITGGEGGAGIRSGAATEYGGRGGPSFWGGAGARGAGGSGGTGNGAGSNGTAGIVVVEEFY